MKTKPNIMITTSSWMFLGYGASHMSYTVQEAEKATRAFGDNTVKFKKKEICNPLERFNKIQKFKR